MLVRFAPDPENKFPVTVPVNVGALVTATEGVEPVPTTTLDPAVRPVKVPVAQGPDVVARSPPVDAWTQLPLVSPVPVKDRADKFPVKVGEFVMDTVGVKPPVEEMFPVPDTEVTGEVTRAEFGIVAVVRPAPGPLN